MRPSFIPRLVNGPLYDPCVITRIMNTKNALMFDCGHIEELSNKEALFIDNIFISHMHMDHFMGMDRILRNILHRDKPLGVFGPPGITDALISKLRAYTWNLTKDYPLEIRIHETDGSSIEKTTLSADSGFDITLKETAPAAGDLILSADRYFVRARLLDHHTPCLGYSLSEPDHINIRAKRLPEKGYTTGPWINELKSRILSGKNKGEIEVRTGEKTVSIPVEKLIEELVIFSPGQKIAYITDVCYSRENIRNIIELAEGADTLFIETFYLEKDIELAEKNAHLTARQAGLIAREARVKNLVPMHISPRYHQDPQIVISQVMEAAALS